MNLGTRKLMDSSFSILGYFSIVLMALALLVILVPIFSRGFSAIGFQGTVEFRRMQLDLFSRGNRENIDDEIAEVAIARQPLYDRISAFESEIEEMGFLKRSEYKELLDEVKDLVRDLMGPYPNEPIPVMPRDRYGKTRWNQAETALDVILYRTEYDYSDPSKMGQPVKVARADDFINTSFYEFFEYLESHVNEMLHPKSTFYPQFITDVSKDAHFFGGIWPEVLGTLALTIGAMLFALPAGVISGIYLVEFASDNWMISILRTCISTLAGVPSIVFALFGLAFFINTLQLSNGKSLLAGSLTLACLILPTIIRSSEEAVRAVPNTYKAAALSLGAGRWYTIVKVVLPAALPGILTGITISMGRAAGETAPIIFTAAVSVGKPLSLAGGKVLDFLQQPTPALSWNIYNLCTEHEAVEEIRHVLFGMVLAIVMLVLMLNISAIVLRARIAKRLRG